MTKNKLKKMNKYRLIGIVIFIIGIILMNTIDNDLSSFISGILIGIGGGMALVGKRLSPRKN